MFFNMNNMNRQTQLQLQLQLQLGLAFCAGMWTQLCWELFFGRNILKTVNSKKKYILRLAYSFENTKTFYIDKSIDCDIVYKFKEFMNNVKNDDEIDIVIETNGGSFSCGQMICNIILSHKGIINAIVLNHAFSAGTLIALSCDNLYMHNNANLSPVDTIHCNFFDAVQLSSIKTVIENKSNDKIDDKTFILSDQAAKCLLVLNDLFDRIIKKKYNENVSNTIKENIFSGEKYAHCTAFSKEQLKNFGLNIYDITEKMIRKCKLVI